MERKCKCGFIDTVAWILVHMPLRKIKLLLNDALLHASDEWSDVEFNCGI